MPTHTHTYTYIHTHTHTHTHRSIEDQLARVQNTHPQETTSQKPEDSDNIHRDHLHALPKTKHEYSTGGQVLGHSNDNLQLEQSNTCHERRHSSLRRQENAQQSAVQYNCAMVDLQPRGGALCENIEEKGVLREHHVRAKTAGMVDAADVRSNRHVDDELSVKTCLDGQNDAVCDSFLKRQDGSCDTNMHAAGRVDQWSDSLIAHVVRRACFDFE